jgi:hypothetical protein
MVQGDAQGFFLPNKYISKGIKQFSLIRTFSVKDELWDLHKDGLNGHNIFIYITTTRYVWWDNLVPLSSQLTSLDTGKGMLARLGQNRDNPSFTNLLIYYLNTPNSLSIFIYIYIFFYIYEL